MVRERMTVYNNVLIYYIDQRQHRHVPKALIYFCSNAKSNTCDMYNSYKIMDLAVCILSLP